MTARSFVRHGPAIPTELLHALEDDKLVLFCGAGVSMGTGLPNFDGLVTHVLKERGYPVDEKGRPTANVAARDAFCRDQFDKALEIIERGESPDSWMMRRAVIKRLTEPPDDDAQLELHRAVLTLAQRRDRAGGYRLVTTNFDDRFELAGLETRWIEQAPRLSPPSRRDLVNLVHLHGRIDNTRPEATGTDLVLTSADFGNAYLHHGWAARFVIELFREFTVLFIGYGLNDPVMRYLVDALAATPSRFRKAYALASYRVSEEVNYDHQKALWSAKNVVPILYAEDYPKHQGHALLRDTVIAWADEHRLGQDGRLLKAASITEKPFVPGRDDAASEPDNVAAVAWALGEMSGVTARRFAQASSPPHPSWWAPALAATIRDPRDPERTCRLLDLDEVAKALATWGCRCLVTSEVIAWAIDQHASIFQVLLTRLPWALSRTEFGYVVPEPYRRFWEIVLQLSGQQPGVEADGHHELPHEDGRLSSKGREFLLRRLRPCLSMTKPWRLMQGEELEPISRLSQLAAIEIKFVAAYPDLSIVKALQSVTNDAEAHAQLLAGLADDLTSALLDHLRLADFADLPFAMGASYQQRQQIAKALDEIDHDDWRILVDLLVETVTSGKGVAPELIEQACRRWHILWRIHDYSLFLRLWLFAVSDWEQLDVNSAIDLVSQPEHLWSFELRSEVLGLLAKRGGEIDGQRLEALAEQLKAGLIRSPRYDDFSEEKFAEHSSTLRGDRLAALAEAGVELEEFSAEQQEAAQRVREHRDYLVSEGWPVGDHGTPWSTGKSGWVEPPSAEHLVDKPALEIARAIIDYRDEHGHAERAEDLFIDSLKRVPARAVEISGALLELSEERPIVWRGLWRGLWDAAEFGQVVGLASTLATLVEQHDILVSGESILSLCRLISKLASNDTDEAVLWRLWDHAWPVAQDHGASGWLSGSDNLDRSINAPGGVLAEVLLSRLGKASQEAGAGFPSEIWTRLDRLVGDNTLLGRYGRILLASRLRWLHHLEPTWTQRVLIDRMDWSAGDLDETVSLWRSYLFSPRIAPDLLSDLKPALLEAPSHRDRLDEQFDDLCYLITAITCIELPDSFSLDEKRKVIRDMGPEGLRHGVWLLERRLANTEDAAGLWRSRIGPWIAQCWPDDREFHDEPLLQRVDKLLLETREAFPAALENLNDKSLVRRHKVSSMVLWLLANPKRQGADDEDAFDYVRAFPRQVVEWLDATLKGGVLSPDQKGELRNILLVASGADLGVVDLFKYPELMSLAN